MAGNTTCKRCGIVSERNMALTVSTRKGTLFVYLCNDCMESFRRIWRVFMDPRLNSKDRL